MFVAPVTEADFGEVVHLANWSYRGAEGAVQSWNIESGYIEGPRLTLDRLREELEQKRDGTLLTFRETAEGPILGTIWAHPMGGDVWHLSLLTVRPDRQSEGFGRRFIQAGEEYARDHGAKRIHLSVLSVRRELLEWYARQGYRLTGETEPYPSGDSRLGKPLQDDLHFVVMVRDL